MPVDEVTYSGVPFGTFIDPVLYPSPIVVASAQSAAEIAESVFPVDNHPAVLAQDMFMPCWRIGWFERSGNPAFTAQDCKDMVARSRATRKSLDWHKQQGNKVLITAHRRAASTRYGPEVYAPVTCMANDMGLETLVGYAERNPSDDTNTPELMDALATRTGLTQFASANVDYYENDQAADASGNTFVNVGGHKFFAQNGNTFPLDKVLFSYSTIAHNENNSVFGPLYERGGANQIINLADGALGTETTSIGSAHACGFIQGGGCGFYGSVAEPQPEEDINNGAGLFTKVLRGATYAEAAFGLNYNQLNLQELMGDGLAQPFADQATSNIMTTRNYKFPIYPSRAGNGIYGIGFTSGLVSVSPLGYGLEIPVHNAAGSLAATIVGFQTRQTMTGILTDFIFDADRSPALASSGGWPSYLTLELVTPVGTTTYNSSISWTQSTLTASNSKQYYRLTYTDGTSPPDLADFFDSANAGVDPYTLNGALSTTISPDAPLTIPINQTIDQALYEDGEVYYVYLNEDSATQLGPFLIDINATDSIVVRLPNNGFVSTVPSTLSASADSPIIVNKGAALNVIENHPASGGGGADVGILSNSIITQ